MALNCSDSSPQDYLSLVQSLLGSSNVIKDKVLPDEIKYVMIALSSEQGPLSSLLVTSGLLTDAASAPARLSLLPRSSVWANGAIEGCVDGSNATGRLAEASNVARFLDLKPAADWGCTAFLSLATAISSSTVIAVVVGFKKRGDCTPLSIRAAKNVLNTAAMHSRESIINILAVTEMLVAPPPLPGLEQDGIDSEYDEEDFIEEEVEINSRSSAAISLADEDIPRDRFTLTFHDPRLESAFAAWHNNNLTKMDMFGFILCLCSAAFILFAPYTAFNKVAKATGVHAWWSIPALLPLLLFTTPRSRTFYTKHREMIVMYVFFFTTHWQLHVENYMNCVEPSMFTRALYLHGFSWLGVLALMFQMRFKLLLPLTVTCFAVAFSLMPKICERYYPESSLMACVSYDIVRTGIFTLVGPLTLVRWMEKHSRKFFFARLQGN